MRPAPAPKYRLLLGKTIRAHRKRAALSQEKLAERADLSRVFIGEIERGEKAVTMDTLLRIAKALGVPVRKLVWDL